jgi:predicted nuclease of predicted toxin-antitoxin system
MILWLDAQLPPALAAWIVATFGIPTQAIRDLGLTTAKDPEIFQAARDAKAVVITKDADFAELVERLGAPPQVLWVTCGNTTNTRLKQILSKCMPMAIAKVQAGDPLIELADNP